MFDRKQKRQRRHKRIRSKAFGTINVPRLCIFRSNKHIHAQLINDDTGKTILYGGDMETGKKLEKNISEKKKPAKLAASFEAGKLFAEKALKNKIDKIIFDRGGNRYHGRIKAFADGAREGGLKF